MRTLVLGDVHGAYKALLQCFERSNFDYEKDQLIVLGDVCDGWSEVKECFDELLKIRHLIYILGNHDWWFLQWCDTNRKDELWLKQGGKATIKSYGNINEVNDFHIRLLKKSNSYYVDDENRMFVHGGINFYKTRPEYDFQDKMWDRFLLKRAVDNQLIANKQNLQPKNLTEYLEIFIGHTSTLKYNILEPMHMCNVWALDTGAGYNGKLTIMDVDTKQYWQSDLVKELYPEEEGR